MSENKNEEGRTTEEDREETLKALVEKLRLGNYLLNAEIKHNNERARHMRECAYCRRVFLKLDIEEHIRECDKHPVKLYKERSEFWMKKWEDSIDERDELIEERDAYRLKAEEWRDKYLGIKHPTPPVVCIDPAFPDSGLDEDYPVNEEIK